jgi:peroxiredoxin
MSTAPRRLIVAAVCAVAVSVGLLVSCAGGKNAVDQGAGGEFRYVQSTQKGKLIPAASRRKAGDVSGELLAGGTYKLSQNAGDVVVLNFLASWCAPCQVETPQYDGIYQQRKAAGVQFVGLDVKDPSKSKSRSWVLDKKISFPVVYDEPGRTALQLGNVPLGGLPATVLIDKQGRVAAVYTGAMLPADLNPALDSLTAES